MALLVCILLTVHALAYIILRIAWPPMRRRTYTIPFWIMAIVATAFRALARSFTIDAFALNALFAVWLVGCAMCLVLSVPLFVFEGVRRVKRRKDEPEDPARRRFLAGAALPATAATVSTLGNINGMRPCEVRYEEVRLHGLPKALDGFRIGQITDTHVGPFIAPDDVKNAIHKLDDEHVDLLTMTGDLIDDMTQLPQTFAALESSRAPHGVLCILGNHEKWHGEGVVRQAYADSVARNSAVKLLVDANVVLQHKGAPLRVVGVDYPMSANGSHMASKAERNALMQTSAQKAFADAKPEETVLCLSHHPDFFPVAARHGASLTLAGHTHGGQVGFLRKPLFSFAFEYMLGRYEKDGSHLYVSAGTGHWLPFRTGIGTEATVITLRAA